MPLGIDIYQRYNKVTNWSQVASRAKYAWIKGTDGSGYPVGGRADSYVAGCKSVGIPVGLYHFAQFGNPTTQANLFASEVRRLKATGLVPMLDLEAPFSPNATARDYSIVFCRRMRALGFTPGIYMSNYFAQNLQPDNWDIPGLVIWIARYGAVPSYGGRFDVHQYTSDGSCPGIIGRVDLNNSYTNHHLTEEDVDMSEFGPESWDADDHTKFLSIPVGNSRLGQLIESTFSQATSAKTDGEASREMLIVHGQRLVAIDEKLANIEAGNVDIEALATAVADKLRDRLTD